MSPKVSIVIPVYNHTDALEKALQSIRAQSLQDFEMIVVDDGSVTPVVGHPEYTLVRKTNGGAPSARNRGLGEARGEYVIFWDADLVGEPRMLEKMVQVLDQEQAASFAYANFSFGFKKFRGQPWDLDTLKKVNYIHSSALVRRADALLWDESLKRFQDWDYFLTLGESGKRGVWIDEYLFALEPGRTMSAWMPSFAYKKPFSFLPFFRERVRTYEEARGVVRKKHHLI